MIMTVMSALAALAAYGALTFFIRLYKIRKIPGPLALPFGESFLQSLF